MTSQPQSRGVKILGLALAGVVLLGAIFSISLVLTHPELVEKQRLAEKQEAAAEAKAVADEKARAAEAKANRAEWLKVASWNGDGIKQTESFDIAADEWRIQWTADKPGAYGSIFQIYVYSSNGTLKTLAANTNKGGSDLSYLHGKGRFYLTISSNQGWTVEVQEPN